MKLNRFFFPILLAIIAIVIAGCESIPVDSIGFCYQDEDGKQYCGNIGFKQAESDKTGAVVVEKEDSGTGEKETLYTFTGDQLNQLFSMFPGLSAARKARQDPVEIYRKIKEIVGTMR